MSQTYLSPDYKPAPILESHVPRVFELDDTEEEEELLLIMDKLCPRDPQNSETKVLLNWAGKVIRILTFVGDRSASPIVDGSGRTYNPLGECDDRPEANNLILPGVISFGGKYSFKENPLQVTNYEVQFYLGYRLLEPDEISPKVPEGMVITALPEIEIFKEDRSAWKESDNGITGCNPQAAYRTKLSKAELAKIRFAPSKTAPTTAEEDAGKPSEAEPDEIPYKSSYSLKCGDVIVWCPSAKGVSLPTYEDHTGTELTVLSISPAGVITSEKPFAIKQDGSPRHGMMPPWAMHPPTIQWETVRKHFRKLQGDKLIKIS